MWLISNSLSCAFNLRGNQPQNWKFVLGLVGTFATGQVGSPCQLTARSTVQHSVRFLFCHFNFVVGSIIMPRTYKRKTERANIAPDTVLRAVRAVRIENRSIRSVARDFGIPFRSLTRYCSRASEDDVRGISQNPTFSIGYKKTRQVSSGSGRNNRADTW